MQVTSVALLDSQVNLSHCQLVTSDSENSRSDNLCYTCGFVTTKH